MGTASLSGGVDWPFDDRGILAWQHYAPARLRLFPVPLVGVILATIVALIGSWNLRLVSLPDSLGQAITFPTLESLSRLRGGPSGYPLFSWLLW